jgi:uroporphyrinogen III methyltransferase/synthase
MGAEVLEIPAIKTVGIEGNKALEAALEKLDEYSWIVFTSQAGVEVFFDRLIKNRIDVRRLGGVKIAAIGSATEKALCDRGLFTDCVPSKYDARSLGKALADAVKLGEKLLIARARIGSKDLTEELDKAGAEYDDIPIYDTLYVEDNVLRLNDILRTKRVDYVAYTSASTVRSFAAMSGDADLTEIAAVCIGEQTELEAKKHGMKTVMSDEITIDSVAAKIMELHMCQRRSDKCI